MSKNLLQIFKNKRTKVLAVTTAVVIICIISIGIFKNPSKAEEHADLPDQSGEVGLTPVPSEKVAEQIIGSEMTTQDGVIDILTNEPSDGKVSLGIFTTERIIKAYYTPDEETQKELIQRMTALDVKETTLGFFKELHSVGINIAYQGLEWELYNNGFLYRYQTNEQTLESTVFYAEDDTLYEMVRKIAERELGIVPFSPSEIKDVERVELSVAFSNNKEVIYNQVITDDEEISEMEKLLSEAEVIKGGSGCPFAEGIMTLTLKDGKQIKLAMATDSCCAYFVNGMYFNYKPKEIRFRDDSGISNSILFDYFDEIPIATRGKD